jgi:hypothetical protein
MELDRGKCEKERKQAVGREKLPSNSFKICVVRAQNIEVKILEQLYYSLTE